MSDALTVNITEAPQNITVVLGDAATVELIENHAELTSGVHGISAFGAGLTAAEDAEAARSTLECLPSDYPVVSGSLVTPELVLISEGGATSLTSAEGENAFTFPTGTGYLAAVDVNNTWTARQTYSDSSVWTYSASALATHLAALGGGNAPTGTGALARATSPTFTSPALGAATGTSLTLSGNLNVASVFASGNFTAGAANYLEFSGRGKLRSGADGLFQFSNNANSGLTRVLFGPSGTAYGAISLTGTGGTGEWRTADGTALAPWAASNITGTTLSLTGQTAASGTSAMTRDLVDFWQLGGAGVKTWLMAAGGTTTANGGAVSSGGGATAPGVITLDSSTSSGGLAINRWSGATTSLSPLYMTGESAFQINWGRRIRLAVEFSTHSLVLTGSGAARFMAGIPTAWASAGTPSNKFIGFEITASGLKLQVHNGTTLTTSASGVAVANDLAHLLILDYFNGTLSASLNGTALTPITGGPSGTSSSGQQTVGMSCYAPDGSSRALVSFTGLKSLVTVS